MFGWFQKKGENARVYMSTKEVTWEIDGAEQLYRAKILAIASALRDTMFEDGELPSEVLDRPLDFSRAELMQVYGILEDIRNNARSQLEQLKKVAPSVGMEIPEFALEHMKDSNRAL